MGILVIKDISGALDTLTGMRMAVSTSLFALLCSLSTALFAAGLPDTGQTTCYDGSSMVACSETNAGDAATYPGQDARYGRDAAAAAGQLTKIGGGDAGFDYTRICNSGELAGQGSCPPSPTLGSSTNNWGCTKDNITGLIWEVKLDDGGLRDKYWTYSWYSDATRSDGTAGALNAGSAGSANGGTCYNKHNGSSGNYCDTAGYVAAANNASLCGASDWRMPRIGELRSLVHYGRAGPAIDTDYFPNTNSSLFWSASSLAAYPSDAWSIYFGYGDDGDSHKSFSSPVRLVRGGQ